MNLQGAASPEASLVRLGQFLKIVGAVATGGEGKIMIQQGRVSVNGQVCTQRGRHLFASDKVSFNGKTYLVADFI